MSEQTCTIAPYTVNTKIICKLPPEISETFPSRGMNMANITLNHKTFSVPLEPDGNKGHFFILTEDIQKQATIKTIENIEITISPCAKWSEPDIPEDFLTMLNSSTSALETWNITTVKARWDWLRWLRNTNNIETRKKRVQTAESMLSKGKKRVCCFNSSACTIAEISKGGKLIL